MLFSNEYQRYKQKLERLQSKVKKSEGARKELEIKFKKLMKERNECEKAATIHKSKYDFMLEQERKRMNRNTELLHMLEEIDTKAAVLAAKTERLKLLKAQQELILMNTWKHNVQQLLISDVPIRIVPIANCFPSTSSTYSDMVHGFGPASDIMRNESIANLPNVNENRFNIVQQSDNRGYSTLNVNPIQRHTPSLYQTSFMSVGPSSQIVSSDNYNKNLFDVNTNLPQHQQHQQQPQQQQQKQQHSQQLQAHNQYLFENKPLYTSEVPIRTQSELQQSNELLLKSDANEAYYQKSMADNSMNSNTTLNRINHIENLNSTSSITNYLPPHKLSNELQISPHQHLNKSGSNVDDCHTYSSIENVNQPLIHYQNHRNQFSFINEMTLPPPLIQQPAALISPPPLPSRPISSSTVANIITATSPILMTNKATEPKTMEIGTNESSVANKLLHEHIPKQTMAPNDTDVLVDSVTSTARSVTDDLQERHSIIDDEQNYRFELKQKDDFSKLCSDKSKINQVFSTDVTKPVKFNDNIVPERDMQQQQLQYNKSDEPKLEEKNIYKRSDSIGIRAVEPISFEPSVSSYTLSQQPVNVEEKRRVSMGSYPISKTDDDLPTNAITTNANIRRRYSVAANLYSLPQNYATSLPVTLNSLPFSLDRKILTSNSTDRNNGAVTETNINRNIINHNVASYTTESEENIKDFSNEKSEENFTVNRYNVAGEGIDSENYALTGVPDNANTAYYSTENEPQVYSDYEYEARATPYENNDLQYLNDAPLSTMAETLNQNKNEILIENQMENLQLEKRNSLEIVDNTLSNKDNVILGRTERNGGESNAHTPTHSKTVTWADDPQNNFKKVESSISHDTISQVEASSENNIEVDGTEPIYQYASEPHGSSQEDFQSDNMPQAETEQQAYYYDDNTYQNSNVVNDTSNAGFYTDPNTNYQDQYYNDNPDQQSIQYASEELQDQNQPYYSEQSTEYVDNPDSVYAEQQPYQEDYQYANYQSQPNDDVNMQYQQQTDQNYYTEEPGENYYREERDEIGSSEQYGYAEPVYQDQNQQYVTENPVQMDQIAISENDVTRTDDSLTASAGASIGIDSYQQPQTQSAINAKVPNYLQSDTEDSHSDVINKPNENIQQHESDFDFSSHS